DRKRSHRCEPTNPAPPVMTVRTLRSSSLPFGKTFRSAVDRRSTRGPRGARVDLRSTAERTPSRGPDLGKSCLTTSPDNGQAGETAFAFPADHGMLRVQRLPFSPKKVRKLLAPADEVPMPARPIRTFTVLPQLPSRLQALQQLAYNMWW